MEIQCQNLAIVNAAVNRMTFPKNNWNGFVVEYYKPRYDAVLVNLHPFFRVASNEVDPSRPRDWIVSQEQESSAERVPWHIVQGLLGAPSLSVLCAVMNDWYSMSIGQYRHPRLVERFTSVLADNCLLLPPDGGYTLGMRQQYLSICEAHFDTGRWDIIQSGGADILFATHHDIFYSFLCTSQQTLDGILRTHVLDGFLATSETRVDWSTPMRVCR